VEKTSETDSTCLSTKTGENNPSRVTEFQDSKEVWSSSVEISKNLPLDAPTQTSGELSLMQDFRNNDTKILSLLNQYTGSYYSFKGLMRKLSLHQQSLARALNRLEQLGLIQRSSNGYKMIKNEQTNAKRMAIPDKRKRGEYKQLLQSYIPTGIKTEEIVRALNGRWFSRIRWIGLVESEIGYMLQWINEDDTFQINLRIICDHLIIETNAISDEDKIEAMVGSCKIFEQITKLLQYHRVKALNSVRLVA
jgi:predicted transcriptional regulator